MIWHSSSAHDLVRYVERWLVEQRCVLLHLIEGRRYQPMSVWTSPATIAARAPSLTNLRLS